MGRASLKSAYGGAIKKDGLKLSYRSYFLFVAT
jgi:hypothetical protein